MATDFTRRELAQLAGTGVLAPSAPATIGRSTIASEAVSGSTTVAQATTQIGEKRAVTGDPSGTAMQRADELLRKMTIEEKAMQLSAVMPFVLLGPEGPIRSQLDAELKNGIGHVSGLGLFGYKTPETTAKTINAIQRYLVTETRLGIPAIFHNEP